MKDFSRNGLIGRAIGLWQEIRDLRIPLHAANTGFFLILSVFPALVLLLSIIRYTPLDVHSLLLFLEGIIPEALLPEMELLIVNTYENTTGAVVSLSAITALWSASRGVYGLITGLNAVYRVPEQRRFLRPGIRARTTRTAASTMMITMTQGRAERAEAVSSSATPSPSPGATSWGATSSGAIPSSGSRPFSAFCSCSTMPFWAFPSSIIPSSV